jgi:hypothetical protein
MFYRMLAAYMFGILTVILTVAPVYGAWLATGGFANGSWIVSTILLFFMLTFFFTKLSDA